MASQRQGLGEFLCWSGLQLIVFFLPVRADVGAEQRPNRGTGCLLVQHGLSPLELLHNIKVLNQRKCALYTGARILYISGYRTWFCNYIVCLSEQMATDKKKGKRKHQLTSRLLPKLTRAQIAICDLGYIFHIHSFVTLTLCK